MAQSSDLSREARNAGCVSVSVCVCMYVSECVCAEKQREGEREVESLDTNRRLRKLGCRQD